jgi:UDP-glucose 4-epimerase
VKIFITGITGFLGRSLVSELNDHYILGGLSRDEHKIQMMWTHYPKTQMFLGDITRIETLRDAIKQFQPDAVIHAAALKVVPLGEMFAARYIQTNTVGTMNLIRSLPETVPIMLISSDKAVDAYNLYGVSKKAAEALVLNGKGNTVVRFGNVFGSTGSVYTVWKKQIQQQDPITVTDTTMTRFFISINQAVHFIHEHLGEPGLWIPKLESYTMEMFLETFLTIFGDEHAVTSIPVRDGEKYHELLVSQNELHQAVNMKNTILISPFHKGTLEKPYGSKTAPRVSIKTLEQEMRKWI